MRHCHWLKHTKSGPRTCGVLFVDKRATRNRDSGLDERKKQVGVILYSGDTDFESRQGYHNKTHFRTCKIKYIKFTVTGQPQDSECSNRTYKAFRFYLHGMCFESRSENCLPWTQFSLFPPGKFPRYTLRLGFSHHFQFIIYQSSWYSTLLVGDLKAPSDKYVLDALTN